MEKSLLYDAIIPCRLVGHFQPVLCCFMFHFLRVCTLLVGEELSGLNIVMRAKSSLKRAGNGA